MSQTQELKAAVKRGDVDAFLPLADELCDEGHPNGEELVELAVTIAHDDDPLTVTMAIAVFQQLIGD